MSKSTKKKQIKIDIPILKPFFLQQEFIDALKGQHTLRSNAVMVIVDDNDSWIYFLSLLTEDSGEANNGDILNIDIEHGILNNGAEAKITVAKAVDVATIYKMNIADFLSVWDSDKEDLDLLPYISLQDQMHVVNKISELIIHNKVSLIGFTKPTDI
ncbi:hypothetical protein [Mycoplasmopsis primatum]|uniref:hypothetical protein n=1 Tax=Mycoplasmopsis primatum TaxID=55604 RepID=UPI00049845BA|nr:hypothetical protein [Mycoplasmopsis primatum]